MENGAHQVQLGMGLVLHANWEHGVPDEPRGQHHDLGTPLPDPSIHEDSDGRKRLPKWSHLQTPNIHTQPQRASESRDQRGPLGSQT